jgi:hypothetical protein
MREIICVGEIGISFDINFMMRQILIGESRWVVILRVVLLLLIVHSSEDYIALNYLVFSFFIGFTML